MTRVGLPHRFTTCLSIIGKNPPKTMRLPSTNFMASPHAFTCRDDVTTEGDVSGNQSGNRQGGRREAPSSQPLWAIGRAR
jgi:hypothetical protein